MAYLALLPGSPALDAGDPAFDATDHPYGRGSGFARVAYGRVDIGAFEGRLYGDGCTGSVR